MKTTEGSNDSLFIDWPTKWPQHSTMSTDVIGASVGSFTCMTCRQLFSSADEQRTHYKTDFHRFNLKRKIAQLAPITMEQFSQKVEGT